MSSLTTADLDHLIEYVQTDIDNIEGDLNGEYCLSETTVYTMERRKGVLIGIRGRLAETLSTLSKEPPA